MKEIKKIDRLFQEKFKDFEANPPDYIWENIASKLIAKKKKRIIPIWWFTYGSVASIAIVFSIMAIVNSNKALPKIDENTKKIVIENTVEPIDNGLIEIPNKSKLKVFDKTQTSQKNKNTNLSNSNLNQENTLVNSATKTTGNKNAVFKNQKTKEIKNPLNPNVLVSTDSSQDKNTNLDKKYDSEAIALSSESKNSDQRLEKNASGTGQEKEIASNLKDETQKTGSYFDNNLDTLRENLIVVEKVEINELEKLLKEKEEQPISTDPKIEKWQVTSNVAPVYFNSVAEGSSIDSEFSNNSKSYETNLSIGLGLQYALNNKITLRSGINRFSLGYNTNGVAFGANLNGRTLAHVNHSAAGATIAVKPVDGPTQLISESFNPESNGYINQRIGYFEVPFEISYKLIDNKLGVRLIGGMSSLLLVENQISIVSQDFSTPIGEANNLNPLSFSTNLGLGIDYPFWKSFNAHLEPVLKYQLNTFNSNVGEFRPYFIAIYTGISYRF